MTVAVRTVNVAQRSAFEWSPSLVSIDEWHRIAQRLEPKNNNNKAHKKLSPSLQHLELLHALQSLTTVRQLAFSPSCGIHADIFVPWWKDTLEDETTKNTNGSSHNRGAPKLKRRLSSLVEQRDGRYRSIHPVQATVSALPTVPPLLSNKKTRLPMRSDVGFPNASTEEIQRKQMEVQQETEWEEASPRLIVLVTSDDLGTAVQEEKRHGPSKQHLEWNGGGLLGMPWAGKELLRTKELSALHFSRKTSLIANSNNGEENANSNDKIKSNNHQEENRDLAAKRKLLEPNRYSVLAPPLDAGYSKTLGWRPRPFHDRPPGMEYLMCWPLEVSFDVKDFEPLVCSLALYSLPTGPRTSDSRETKNGGVYGKMSEEFTFQAGNWDDRIDLDPSIFSHLLANPKRNKGNNTLDVQAEEDLLENWCKRKQKAIFSYDPLAIPDGKESLHWVLQIFRVAHSESGAAYLQNEHLKRNGSVSKLFRGKSPMKQKNSSKNEGNLEVQEAGVNQFFEKFGTKCMMPLAYGVTPVFPGACDPSSDSCENDTMNFPKGRVQDLTLYASPSEPESQEDFVRRLSEAAHYQAFANGSNSSSSLGTTTQVLDTTATSELASMTSSALDHSISNTASNLTTSSHSDEKTSKLGNNSPPHKKKSIAQRIFKSPVKATRSLSGSSASASHYSTNGSVSSNRVLLKNHTNKPSIDKNSFKPLAASVNLFTSKLSVDFLQTMLSEPSDMDGFVFKQHPSHGNQVPKILCDVSGDFAVMIEDREMDKKRSNLTRLPCHRKPAGYIAASEIREILYLPARPEKQYDLDVPPSYRSHINLLYLYPLLLRLPAPQKNSKVKKDSRGSVYTVRVRLLRSSFSPDVDQVSGKIVSSNNALEAFHNPYPWAGPALLKEVYTKVPLEATKTKNAKHGGQGSKYAQPMRDELKLRLPLVLDGTFYLEFALFELVSDSTEGGAGVSMQIIGENTIPLSSSSVRDAAGGVRVATVIPNGCHRLGLGDFKFYVESRVISSIHIGDAAVAVALRDFPVAAVNNDNDNVGDRARSMVSRFAPAVGNASAHSTRGDPSRKEIVTFPTLFSNASNGNLAGHFQLLLYMHLSNLIDPSGTDGSPNRSSHGELMMGCMRSLFEIFNKVKARLDSSTTSSAVMHIVASDSRKRFDVFLKKILDDYEESFLSPSRLSGIEEEGASDMGSDIVDFVEARTGSTTKDGIVDEEEFLDEGAVRVRHKDSLRTGIDARLSKRGSAGMDITSVSSFSRVAYGASKLDRLRIEAEMYYEGGRFALPVFDDDETVVTAGTSLHNIAELKRKQMAAASLERQNNGATSLEQQNNGATFLSIRQDKSGDYFTDSSVKAATAAASRVINDQKKEYSSSDGLAKKVKTVAKVMLQPCVGPDDSSTSPRRLNLDCGRSSRQNRRASPNSVVSRAVTKPTQLDATEAEKVSSEIS